MKQYTPEVDRLFYQEWPKNLTLTRKQWVDLAVACLDQAGFTHLTQKAVRAWLEYRMKEPNP